MTNLSLSCHIFVIEFKVEMLHKRIVKILHTLNILSPIRKIRTLWH
jgi:hypothetical protein